MQKLDKAHILGRSAAFDPDGIADRPFPEKVLQFGEGGFLRGFADWMIHRMNRRRVFEGRVVVVQPIEQGMTDELNRQDGLYTLLRRGLRGGGVVEDREVVSSISRGINPYTDFAGFLDCARIPDLRFIISNTTEAGIAYRPGERPDDEPPASFPGKVARFLYERFRRFGGNPAKGFIFLPCELIDRNGDTLKRIVLRLAEEWHPGSGFAEWITGANTFCNTLVDEIMTGYPREEIAGLSEQAGYEDALYDTGELFRLWVIEGPEWVRNEFPLHEADMDVVWTSDMTPYRTRKVRILNGAHTMTVLGAYLAGRETVMECMEDPVISAYMKKGIGEEIIPVLTLPEEELRIFAGEVLERFANPFIRHYLLSIALNSAAKYKARVLPTIREYCAEFGRPPEVLSWSMAALIAFYRGTEMREGALVGRRGEAEYLVRDDADVLEFFRGLWAGPDGKIPAAAVRRVLGNPRLWDDDLNLLPGFAEKVTDHFTAILGEGVLPSMARAAGLSA